MNVVVRCESSCAVPSQGVVARSGETRVVTVEKANALVRTGKFTIVEMIADPQPAPVIKPDCSQDSVETIIGIGPAKTRVLTGMGIETLEELAFCDPQAVADETDLRLSDIEKWQVEAQLKLGTIQEE